MHCFYFDINEGKICIGYGMVIMWDTMVKLGLITDLKKEQDVAISPIQKQSRGIVGPSLPPHWDTDTLDIR